MATHFGWIEALNLLAILVSPVIAVAVSVWIQNRSVRKGAKMQVFSTLVANRHRPITDENIRALHMIDVVFADEPRVRSLWHRYFDLTGSQDGTGDLGYKKREQIYRDMLVAMGRELGFSTKVEQGDIERIYQPVGLGEQTRLQEETQKEFLRVLKSSESFGRERGAVGGSELESKPMGLVQTERN